MRYPPGHKEKTKKAILEAAARIFRCHGFHGGGVDAVMAEAGLTVGGFYAHFKNKEDLLFQLLEASPELFIADVPEEFLALEGMAWVEAYIAHYLSPEHRDAAANCCPLPSLMSEIERRGTACREAFAKVVDTWVQMFTKNLTELPEEERPRAARAIVTMGIGACSAARAMGNTPESDSVLEAARNASLLISYGEEKKAASLS